MTQRSVLNWMALGLLGLVGCQQAPAYAEPTGAASGAQRRVLHPVLPTQLPLSHPDRTHP